MGLLPTPAVNESFEQAYSQARTIADLVPVWGRPSPFYTFASDLSGSWGDAFVTAYTRGNGMIPFVDMSFMGTNLTLATPPGIANATLSNPAWRASYEAAALDVVKAVHPLFLSLGNEVNRWYEKYGASPGDPNGFQNYVSLYEQTYDAVKKLSPQTYVFCIFAREMVDEHRAADLSVLKMFDASRMDMLVFTSYPFAVQGIKSPDDIPSDYYSSAAAYMPNKPFGLSEAAWPADPYFGGEKGQARFLAQVAGNLTRGQGMDLRILCWSWLHDLASTDTTGLMTMNGTPRQAYRVWQELVSGVTDRYASIPLWAPKYTPANDTSPPIVHSSLWQQPVPMPGPIDTAGAEDSPFITPDGNTFYFFFTPNLRVPATQQVGDGVTGIWMSTKTGGGWSDPVRVHLGSNDSLDGCEFIQGNTMWFCSARAGNYRGVDIYTAQFADGAWTDIANAGSLLNQVYQIGEPTLSPDGNTLYYGSNGQIWETSRNGSNWTEPTLVSNVQGIAGENQPFVTPDGQQLWFTGYSTMGYPGPAIFMSAWNGTGWGKPAEIVSQFAGEPVLDAAGNLYFVHHFLDANGDLAEADIYVAYRN